MNNTQVFHLGGTDVAYGTQRNTIYEFEGKYSGWRLWENVLPINVGHDRAFISFPDYFCEGRKSIFMDQSYQTGNYDHLRMNQEN